MPHACERTILSSGTFEVEVRKSRFLCSIDRATTEEEARTTIERVRKEHWSANHHCTAWRIGRDGRLQRSNDDGEPSGTAGVPMLEVLNHRGLTDLVAVVTRYFGGTRLGVGGLIRAYGSAVSAAIDHIGIVDRRPLHLVNVAISHADSGRIEHALRTSDHPPAGVTYNAADVTFTLHLDPADLEPFRTLVAGLTAGRASVQDTGVMFVDVPVESGDS
jgi:uncharacterized YigZ family protein